MKHWLAAFRLKTLPLALGAILLGSTLHVPTFNRQIFLFAALTAIFLQILSNLANDYGDFVKGTDKHRTDRQLAGGNITLKSMHIAIVVCAILALISGLYLLHISFGHNWFNWFVFLGLGLASIAAAIMYTVGKKAYGYNGLGDIFVFVFFGIIGVLGSAFLQNQTFQLDLLLPAISYGCLCVGVLNVNNIRDLDKDVLTNKITLAAKLGKQNALGYQQVLMIVSFVCLAIYHWSNELLTLAPMALFLLGFLHSSKLVRAQSTSDYNQQLKMLSLGSLIVAVLFAIGLPFS